MKTLIASGCSYTWAHGLEGVRIEPAWPELLAKKLRMKCVNLGSCGAGNEYIYSSILDKIATQKDIGLVIAMWSEFQRLDYEDESGTWQGMHLPDILRGIGLKEPWNNDATKYLVEKGYGRTKQLMERSMRYFYTFQKVMQSFDFPYLQMQGTYHFPYHDSRLESENMFLESEYIDLIDDTKFLGWPIAESLGGFSWDSYLDELDPKREKFRLESGGHLLKPKFSAGRDSHPNAAAHELIADFLYKEIKKNEIL
jgi:hypothetical protein